MRLGGRPLERVEVRRRARTTAGAGSAGPSSGQVDERVRRDVREQVIADVRDTRLLVGEDGVGRAVPGRKATRSSRPPADEPCRPRGAATSTVDRLGVAGGASRRSRGAAPARSSSTPWSRIVASAYASSSACSSGSCGSRSTSSSWAATAQPERAPDERRLPDVIRVLVGQQEELDVLDSQAASVEPRLERRERVRRLWARRRRASADRRGAPRRSPARRGTASGGRSARPSGGRAGAGGRPARRRTRTRRRCERARAPRRGRRANGSRRRRCAIDASASPPGRLAPNARTR